ncbi:hypothetical protein HBI62_041020 [Parastagonospora nodorum]|nr:hypothetical protein HBI62_041020 [Parastagonospora nodorum]KAH6144742.1 hypothetical protein HBI63_175820 [Parastagonospora nodorum]KAH6173875.1 hypothetical protein HBI61_156770 [Parastagonospora nodorum]
MCAKDNLIKRKSPLSTSIQTSNHVNIFSLDFAFSFANILSLIAFIISYCLFADKLNIQQSLLDRATVVLIIILVNKTQLLLILGDRLTPSTLLARFIPTTKIRNPLLKTLENAAKSRILLAYADRRIRQYYLTICAILKHYNFNIHVSLATDILHLLLKGLVIKMLDFMQDILDDIYPSTIISLLFILKAPFALYFIRAVCDLVTLAINIFKEEFQVYQRTLEEKKNFNYPNICTRANSKAYYITIVKQFYSIINKKEYILQIYLHNSQRTALLAADYTTIVKQKIQPYLTKLPLSKVTANIAISNFTHAAVLHLILIIINYTCYNKDRKHIAYIRAFSKVLLFNNNKQINNTTRMLTFKFYDLSTIICLVHLVPRDLPNSTTYTTISYYVNNYIN